MLTPIGALIREGSIGRLSGRWLLLVTTPPTVPTSGGIQKGSYTNAVVEQLRHIAGFMFCSPPAVAATANQLNARRLHFLFALRERNLWSIICPYPSILLNGFRDMTGNADSFLRDLSDGTLTGDLELTTDQKRNLMQLLGKHPERAKALSKLIARGRFNARHIWPNLQVVFSASSGPYRFYVEQLGPMLGGVPVFSSSYAASEGIIGIGVSVHRPGYAVSPTGAYIEFLPVEDVDKADATPHGLRDVEVNGIYEIVMTTYTGLVRYRLGDLVKVLGWYGETPVIDFVERRGQVLDVAGEKVTEAQIVDAFVAACRKVVVSFVDFIVTIDGKSVPPKYLLLIEREGAGESRELMLEFLANFDRELRERSFYAFCRRNRSLDPMAALVLERGSFEKFYKYRLSQGTSIDQIKIRHVVRDPTFAAKFFAKYEKIVLPQDRLPAKDFYSREL